MTAMHFAIEADENTAFPKLEFRLIAPSGRIVETYTDQGNAIAQRDKLRANGGNVRLIEVTTITVTREVE
jgi:CobQ-like glutamine amidotransferase family enzyme